MNKFSFSAQVQLGVAVPSRHFSGLWQNCVLAPPDLQLISQVNFGPIFTSKHLTKDVFRDGVVFSLLFFPKKYTPLVQDNPNGIPVHRALLLSFSPTLAPILNSPCCAAPMKACFVSFSFAYAPVLTRTIQQFDICPQCFLAGDDV